MNPFPILTSLLILSAVLAHGTTVVKGDFFAVTAVKPLMELPEARPDTLRDAMVELERNMPAEHLARINAMKSADAMATYQRELGPLIRIRWGLGKEQTDRNVAHDLREKGILRTTDMSAAILHAFWGWQHGRNPPSEIALWVERHPELALPAEEKPPVKPVYQAITLEEAHISLERILSQEALDKVDVSRAENELIARRLFLSGTGPEPVLELRGPFAGFRGEFDYDADLLEAAKLPEISRVWGEPEPPESPIVRHLRELGFTDVHDIQAVILDTFWCRRHGKDFRIQERVGYYKTYWTERKTPDGTAVDPDDRSSVEWLRSYPGEGRTNRIIHIGRSKGSGRLLAFEWPVGTYVVDKALLDELREIEANRGMRLSDGVLPEIQPAYPPVYDGKVKIVGTQVKAQPPERKKN